MKIIFKHIIRAKQKGQCKSILFYDIVELNEGYYYINSELKHFSGRFLLDCITLEHRSILVLYLT
jgi:hypothetical protein